MLERSDHPNVVHMVDRMKSKNSYYLILDYCNGGDMASLLSNQERLTEVEAREVIYQVVDGMSHLHSLGVIHRDIKLANLLLHFPNMEGSVESQFPTEWSKRCRILSEELFIVKIADLGFSKIQNNINNDLSTTYCGTPINMAPEVLNREAYGYKSDVWSVGTILFELIAGQSPFKDALNKDELRRKH